MSPQASERPILAGMTIFRAELEAYLQALGLNWERLLPHPDSRDTEPDQLADYYLNRANAFNVIDGVAGLTRNFAIRFRGRLQYFLESAYEDRANFAKLNARRGSITVDSPVEQIREFCAKILDETNATPNVIRTRNEEFLRVKHLDATSILDLADKTLRARSAAGTVEDLFPKLLALSLRPKSLIIYEKGSFSVIDHNTLFERFRDNLQIPDPDPAPEPMPIDGFAMLRIELDQRFNDISDEDISALFREFCRVRAVVPSEVQIIRPTGVVIPAYTIIKTIKEGCTTIELQIEAGTADALVDLFRRGSLTELGVLQVKIVGAAEPVRSDNGNAEQVFTRSIRSAVRRELWLRPWRRLRFLPFPGLKDSPIASVIMESDKDNYVNLVSTRDSQPSLPILESPLRCGLRRAS